MQSAPEIRPYPWAALDTVPREALGAMRDARRALRRAIDERKVSDALSELLGEHVSVLVTDVIVAAEPLLPLNGATVALATSDGAVRVTLEVERELARTLVSRVVGRPLRLGDPRHPLEPEVEGGLAAIACSVARRAHGATEALRPVGQGPLRVAPGERRLDVHATLLIGADAYAVRASVETRRTFAQDTSNPADELASLGAIPITLPVIIATSIGRTGDLRAAAPGDVWMPGSGWSIERRDGAAPLVGDVTLAAPTAERAIRAKLGENGEIMVLGVVAVRHDAEATAMSTPKDDTTATSEAVLAAPLVVRVELGAVTMAAREWAALRSGDVIAVGRRVSEPVVLRIAGVEVARGELVDVEGELGVRIRERIETP